jgi:CBS domain-containing protein
MLVENILPRARERLRVADARASVAEAARLMREPEADLLVVCEAGAAIGVVTKTDIIGLVGAGHQDFSVQLSTIMTRDLITCRSTDRLYDVWLAMSAHRRQRVPVLEADAKPVGVVYARDALKALLRDAEREDEILRAYVQGVGYH